MYCVHSAKLLKKSRRKHLSVLSSSSNYRIQIHLLQAVFRSASITRNRWNRYGLFFISLVKSNYPNEYERELWGWNMHTLKLIERLHLPDPWRLTAFSESAIRFCLAHSKKQFYQPQWSSEQRKLFIRQEEGSQRSHMSRRTVESDHIIAILRLWFKVTLSITDFKKWHKKL